MTISRFAFPTAIHFGAGARRLVADHLLERGIRRPLVVTDRALAALPVAAEFRSLLAGLDVAVFDGVHGNPRCAQVMAPCCAILRLNNMYSTRNNSSRRSLLTSLMVRK